MNARLPPVTTKIPIAVEALTVHEPSLPWWKEVDKRVIAYLTACGITDDVQVIQLVDMVKRRVANRLPLSSGSSLSALAIEETGWVIDQWLIQELALEYPHDRGQMLAAARAALLLNANSGGPKNGLPQAPGSMAAAIQRALVVPVPSKNGLSMKTQTIRLRPIRLRRLMRRLLRWLRVR